MKLSNRVTGMKFMQRAQEKKVLQQAEKEKAEEKVSIVSHASCMT